MVDIQLRQYPPPLAPEKQPFRLLDPIEEDEVEKVQDEVLIPERIGTFLWKSLNFLIVLYFLVSVPFYVAFGAILSSAALYGFMITKIVLLSLSTLEMLTNFFIAFYENGRLVLDRSVIRKAYLRFNFFIDLIGILAIFIPIFLSYSYVYIELIYIIKLVSVSEYFRSLRRVFFKEKNSGRFYLTVQITFTVILFTHYMSCGFYLIGRLILMSNHYGAQTESVCWLTNSSAYSPIWGLPVWQQYVYSMYYGIQILTTIAFGDVLPLNPYETVYSMFMYLAAVIWFAFIIEEVISILTDEYTKRYEFYRQMKEVERFMRKREVALPIYQKVLGYFQYLWISRTYYKQDQLDIISQLTPELKDSLEFQANSRFISQLSLLNGLSPKVLHQVFESIEEIHVSPHQVIPVPPNGEHALILCDDVRYEIVHYYQLNAQPKRLRILKQQTLRLVGQYQFFMDQPSQFTYHSLRSTVIFRLKKSPFLQILRDNGLMHRFIRQRDLIMAQEYEGTGLFCFICKQKDHLYKKCPKVFYQVHGLLRSSSNVYRVQYQRPDRKCNRFKSVQGIFGQDNLTQVDERIGVRLRVAVSRCKRLLQHEYYGRWSKQEEEEEKGLKLMWQKQEYIEECQQWNVAQLQQQFAEDQ